MSTNAHPDAPSKTPKLARRLGLFDVTMLVMGGIVGAGICMYTEVGGQYTYRRE